MFSVLRVLWYFVFVAAYVENAFSQGYVDAKGSRFFRAALGVCGHSSFRSPQI
jgi:hypothetical protein